MRIPITAKLSAGSPFHPFLLCLCSRILCPDYRAEQTCEACSLQCEPCGLSGLQAPNAIIPLLAWSPRQGKCALLKASKPFPLFLFPPLFLSCIFPRSLSGTGGSASASNTHPVPKPLLLFLLYIIPLAFKPKNLGHNKNLESLPIPQIFVGSTWCHFARLLLFVKLS